MHPIFARTRRVGLYALLSVPASVLVTELLVATGEVSRGHGLLLVTPVMVVHAFGCLASWYVCRSLPFDEQRLGRTLVAQLGAALLASGVALGLLLAWANALDRPGPGPSGVGVRSAVVVFVFALFLYLLATAVHYLFLQAEQRRAAERSAYELRLLAQEARLAALKAQIDPHFLFNSLNVISALVRTEPDQARTMCVELAALLRRSLRLGQRTTVSLAEEVDLVHRYLAVERMRFGPRLEVETSLAEGCAACPVPPLLLLPLVENAVKHGIAHCLEGGTVGVRAWRARGLHIEVTNPCDPDRPPVDGEGIGLANVRQRLANAFGREAVMHVESEAREFLVTLVLPVRAGAEGRGTEEGSA